MFTHSDIWHAIDRLAERHGLSASGLAKRAGLSATLFNPSKRATSDRKRWPSTESIAAILKATNCSPLEFINLMGSFDLTPTKIPLLGLAEASSTELYDPITHSPLRSKWDEAPLPGATDDRSFVIEITGRAHEPTYREGDRLLLSPAEKLRRGDRVGVATTQGELLIRILGREGAQKIELLPLNHDSTPLTLARKDVLWICRITWASQ